MIDIRRPFVSNRMCYSEGKNTRKFIFYIFIFIVQKVFCGKNIVVMNTDVSNERWITLSSDPKYFYVSHEGYIDGMFIFERGKAEEIEKKCKVQLE